MKDQADKLLIAAVTPSLLEKGADWFSENFSKIEKFRRQNPFWRRNVLIFEAGQNIKLSEFLRNVTELEYTKVWETEHRGEFSQRGGVVHIFPINSENIFAIEFNGNFIEKILGKSFASSLKVKPTVQRQNFFLAGDYVVHIDHGIGIFRGEKNEDYIIEYASPKNRPNSPDLLFVPQKEIKRIQPYLGFKKPEIHRLGTLAWSLTKKKAKEDILVYAKELLEIFAKRKIASRPPYQAHHELEEELISNFQYEYTPDQKKVLEEIFTDMTKNIPMDRVVVGDVGFGKTELAVLAAFRAVLGGKQVAIMAPTTILADQHFEVFKKRLEKFGVEIARLTRLESAEKIKEILKKIEDGRLDIIIGTHKILGKNINFKNLGLLIIDEEQKFGVAQKEKFNKENPALDILTLSATPIPRTLQSALSGIRVISEISTPPEGRMKIETFVLPKNKKLIKEAISRELKRKGQIYFLANRIHKIPALLEEIKGLKTGAKIGILHGRMNESAIIKTMHDFREGKLNLLVSTTIIENGLDLSNVNTLIVEDATCLGLSQAHQLRGRIGRGDKEAFAYFLFTAQKLKEKAAERLEALERYSWLGAGLEIAKRDLEIRGAGNILGRAQSGIAFRIGLNLYFELLEEAISEVKGFDKKT